MDLFPESSLIFLLRDGRDVVDSWLDAYRDGSWATDEGAYPLDDGGRPALIRWQSSVWLHRTEVVQETYARTDPDRRLLIRYEEMRERPVRALERIRGLLGLEAGREELERIAGRSATLSRAAGPIACPARRSSRCTRSSPRSSTSWATCSRATFRSDLRPSP
jgi:hypothetical protein